MYDAITVGSATVDIFMDTGDRLFQKADSKGHIRVPFGSKILVENLRMETGGGGTNSAAAFARLGFRTAYIGKIGTGPNSEQVLNALRSEGIATEFVARDKSARTGLSAILDAEGHDRTILAYKGSNDHLHISDVDITKFNAKLAYFGSMLGDSFKTIEKLSAIAKKKGMLTAFNPSSYLAAKGRKFLAKMLRNTDILVLNKEEAQLVLGRKVGAKETLKGLSALGPEIVVVTDGRNEAYGYDGIKTVGLMPGNVKVIEATGAGDAFAAGFVAGRARGKSLEFCMQLGLAESQSVITHIGSKQKLLTWSEAIETIRKSPGRIRCL